MLVGRGVQVGQQAADAHHELAVGLGIVDGPVPAPVAGVGGAGEIELGVRLVDGAAIGPKELPVEARGLGEGFRALEEDGDERTPDADPEERGRHACSRGTAALGRREFPPERSRGELV